MLEGLCEADLANQPTQCALATKAFLVRALRVVDSLSRAKRIASITAPVMPPLGSMPAGISPESSASNLAPSHSKAAFPWRPATRNNKLPLTHYQDTGSFDANTHGSSQADVTQNIQVKRSADGAFKAPLPKGI